MAEEAAGYGEMPKHGDFCWTEIASNDLGKCKEFYTNVFGWQFNKSEAVEGEMQYLEFSSEGGTYPDGALYQLQPEMFGGGEAPPPHIALYVAVDNVDDAIAKSNSIGGGVIFGPMDIPNVGRFAILADPTGAAISVITLAEGAA